MKLALVQVNPTIGDVEGNAAAVLDGLRRAADLRADLAIFPEQVLLGYPAKDLLLRREAIERNAAALRRVAAAAVDVAAVVGFAEPNESPTGRPTFNSAAVLSGGRVIGVSRKRLLPTYDIFDEARYFEPGGPQPLFDLCGRRVAVTICEDMWSQESLLARPLYACDPIGDAAGAGADLIVNVSASPFTLGKPAARLALMGEHCRRRGVALAYVNQVGGNDELLFDGASCVMDGRGRVVAQAAAFREDLLEVDLSRPDDARREALPDGPAALHAALCMGLRDYARKCGFREAVLGLSGGVDSAVVACLAADAFGPQNVLGVAMPGRYSSAYSLEDARRLAENLGIRWSVIPIESIHAAAESALRPSFAGRPADTTEENLQARARGMILMAISNKLGCLLLTTGNKSELAVGYCTLYGDMCGGLAVISDVPKTMVYELARHINQRAARDVIPQRTITRPPSAELRPDQTDQDSLPPYDTLDGILRLYEEELRCPEEIVAAGYDPETVRRVVRMIQVSEYKRRQAAPGLKVTSRAFGFGRRMPIAARTPGAI